MVSLLQISLYTVVAFITTITTIYVMVDRQEDLVVKALASIIGTILPYVSKSLRNHVYYVPIPPHNSDYVRSYDVEIPSYVKDSTHKATARIFEPIRKSNTKIPLILYFHGGGFIFGSSRAKEYDQVLHFISNRTQAVILAVEYALAPEYKFPQSLYDAFNAYAWISDHNERLSFMEYIDTNMIVVAGDDTGTLLATALVLIDNSKELYMHTRFMSINVLHLLPYNITLQVLIDPFLVHDISEISNSTVLNRALQYVNRKEYLHYFMSSKSSVQTQKKDPFINPFDIETFVGHPTTLIIVPSKGMYRNVTEEYINKLKKANVNVITKRYDSINGFFFSDTKSSKQAHSDTKSSKQAHRDLADIIKQLF